MAPPDVKTGDFARYKSRWGRVIWVKAVIDDYGLGEGIYWKIRFEYHDGSTLVRETSGDFYEFKPISKATFIAHEKARGNTAWNLW